MGRGNCCVFGSHEGLYFIDNDDFHVYRKIGSSSEDCPENAGWCGTWTMGN